MVSQNDTSNARFLGADLPKHVKKFPTADHARAYAQDVITDHHLPSDFHVCVHGEFYYLVVVDSNAVAAKWLEAQGFVFIWVRS